MDFYIKFTSNILMGMTRMPLGSLEIKFSESKIFIHRIRLNRLIRHRLKSRLAKRREILIFPRAAGNTGNSRELMVNSRELLVIPGITGK